MNRIFRYLLLVGVLVGASAASFADTFYFNYSGAGVSAKGTITATLTSPGTYLVTDMSGTRNGVTITDVRATSNSGFIVDGVQWTFDNLLFTTPPQVDNSGILFDLAGTPFYANLYSVSTGLLESIQLPGNGQYSVTPVDFNISSTPEPGSLILFGSGALGLAGMIRRKLMV